MKQLLFVAVAALFLVTTGGIASAGDTCFICTSDSSDGCKDAKYCDPSGPDTSENRKKCQAKGCKIGGTASCPSAANVKVCKATALENEYESMEAEATLSSRLADATYRVSAILRGECV